MSSTPPAAPRRRVLIVEDDTLVGLGLRNLLERLGHDVVGHASTPEDAMTTYESTKPDLVLMDIRLDNPAADGPDGHGPDGIELAGRLLAKRRCPMIIISAYSERGLIDRATEAGVFGYLIKPVSGESLAAQMEVAVGRFAEHERLRLLNEQLSQTLENRKIIEKAKGIFMEKFDLGEADAHRRLQLESQKRRITLVDLAKKIIESAELLGGK